MRSAPPAPGPDADPSDPGNQADPPDAADPGNHSSDAAHPSYPPPADTGGAAARRYHARYGRVLPAIDPAAGSTPPKHHPGAPVLPLPFPPVFPAPPVGPDSPSPAPDSPSADRDRDPAAAPERLGGLLALLNGVTRVDWTGAGVGAGRPVPSGGGTYPAEVYTAGAAGLCHYLPSAHALELLSRADLRADLARALDRPPPEPPESVLLITSRLDANLARYGPFGHRLQALDTGVLTGQALTLLESAGAAPMAHVRFAGGELGRLLGLDPEAERVHAVVTARTPGAITPDAPLLRRRSARSGFEPVPVPLADLLTVLEDAARPIPLDHAAPADCDLYVVAHRVTGLAAGCHRRDPGTGRLVPVGGDGTPRSLFPPGGPGELAGYEAACAVLVTGDYESGYPEHGDRWYQMLNLRAGVIGQRIGLAAARAGLGAGLRCDVDTAAADALLGPHSDPTHPDGTHPGRADSARTDPGRTHPDRTHPDRTDSDRADPARTHPDRTTLLAALLGQERGSGTPACPLLHPSVPTPPRPRTP